jgi:hypothetical protein
MAEKILAAENRVVRHSRLELAEHWAIALSGLVLLLTGIFELPVAKRYYIITVPGLGWSADFITSLYLHYAAAFVFTAAALFHLVNHGLGGERDCCRKGAISGRRLPLSKVSSVWARSRRSTSICRSSVWRMRAWHSSFCS